ncbi:MAG: FAD-dependent oxidoreductase [Actinomycetota bacterium]|nr:FAD-dependent oxidoreductase [Actinomycetota bacterium]
MILGLDLGAAVKVITEFETRFWEPQGLSGFMITDLPFGVGWAPTDSYRSTQGLLTQFITGSPAEHGARLDRHARAAWATNHLDEVFPQARTNRNGPQISQAWANERHTGGGYAIFRPGQVVKFWPVLRSGFARVRFAGEHTEILDGDMESAIRSGHRVAANIGAPPRHRTSHGK